MRLHRTSAIAAAAVLLTGPIAATATASATVAPQRTSATAAAVCQLTVGFITSGGDLTTRVVSATTPPSSAPGTTTHLFSPGAARTSSTWTSSSGVGVGHANQGLVVLGSSLYSASYGQDDAAVPFQNLRRIGGGWDVFTVVEQSYADYPSYRTASYGLRNDGVLFRWTDNWRKVSSYPGFSAVKTMTLISETATYDTFLATTRGGALYTIRIPATTPMKPVVTLVRSRSWQSFDDLVAERCGRQSTLLTAIDRDNGSAQLFAVGHANGSSTLIQGLGPVPGTYSDPVHQLSTTEGAPPLYGQ